MRCVHSLSFRVCRSLLRLFIHFLSVLSLSVFGRIAIPSVVHSFVDLTRRAPNGIDPVHPSFRSFVAASLCRLSVVPFDLIDFALLSFLPRGG